MDERPLSPSASAFTACPAPQGAAAAAAAARATVARPQAGSQALLRTWLTVRCRWMVDDCSACTLMMSAPALAKSATRSSGSTIICAAAAFTRHKARSQGDGGAEPSRRVCPGARRAAARRPRHPIASQVLFPWLTRWQSRTLSVTGRSASTTRGPMVMLGTKRPSITSTWIQSAPATSTALTCTPLHNANTLKSLHAAAGVGARLQELHRAPREGRLPEARAHTQEQHELLIARGGPGAAAADPARAQAVRELGASAASRPRQAGHVLALSERAIPRASSRDARDAPQASAGSSAASAAAY